VSEQILLALQFAHEHNVIHRDIKPHNIIVNNRGQVKVTDFGIARAGTSAKMTETGSILGTAQYLSPEQAKGQAVEQGSDLYSLGVVLYEMLTGRVPFEGENPVAIALKHLSDEPVPPQALVPDIPDNLNAVVMRALAKDPRDRYGSAQEFAADLQRCRNNLPVEPLPMTANDMEKTSVIGPAAAMGAAQPGTAPTMTQPQAGRPGGGSNKRTWLYAIMAIVALAALAAGIYFLAFAQQGSDIAVPNVVGMDRAQAEDAIRAQGLQPAVDSEENSDTVPAGKVIRQNPEAGAKIKSNGTVSLVISKGSSKVPVPGDLAGQSASFVETKLREAGLVPDRQPDAYSETVAEGNVISVDPVSGTQVEKGSKVKYMVSKGQAPPKEVSVPDVRGLTISEASSKLGQSGLSLGGTTEQFSETVASGRVISQSPVSGSKINEGSTVDVVLSKGPQPTPQVSVPNVKNQTLAEAGITLGAAGLVVGNVSSASSATVPVDEIISQDPASGTMVDEGTAVDVVVSTGP
jgi:serine/threonine-protein kinase